MEIMQPQSVLDTHRERISCSYSRDALIQQETTWKVSDLGVVQFRNGYSESLLNTILEKALHYKEHVSQKRHLNLKYIRAAHNHIPEIGELLNDKVRLQLLSDLAETKLEPYPISVISAIVTFMGEDDGVIPWHSDGVPCSELIPLQLDGVEGGDLLIYNGHYEQGLARLNRGEKVPEHLQHKITHKTGHSTLGQYIRLLHRVSPIRSGTRVTLNLNLRSVNKPYIDDNSICYLAADNPDFDFVPEVINDVKTRQLPSYRQSGTSV